MTGLRGARWTGTGNSASQEAHPELSCGVGSLQQAPRWNADRRRVAWILCAQICVHLSAWTRAAPPPLSSPKRGRMTVGARRLEIRVCRRSASFSFVARKNEVKSVVGVESLAVDPDFAESVIGPATSGGTRWLPRYGSDFAARDHGDAGPTAGLT
jgi:hypothetical protein